MTDALDDRSIVCASRRLRSSRSAGEIALLEPESGTYFTLSGSGAFIWERIQEPTPIATVKAAVVARFDVSAAECHEQLVTFIRQLSEKNLVDVTPRA